MTKNITIVNAETNEIIEREMTAEELAEHQATIEDAINRKNETKNVFAQKEAILAKLGITEEEAKLLLS